jgi:hypothetical protein
MGIRCSVCIRVSGMTTPAKDAAPIVLAASGKSKGLCGVTPELRRSRPTVRSKPLARFCYYRRSGGAENNPAEMRILTDEAKDTTPASHSVSLRPPPP